MASMENGILSYEWSCPSCTFNNKPSAFKCLVCGTPKGTTTRQTKYHSSTVQKQHMVSLQLQAARTASLARIQNFAGSSTEAGGSSNNGASTRTITKKRVKNSKSKAAASKDDVWPRLKNIDRSSKQLCKITVDNFSVIITEYDTLYSDSD